MGSISRRSGTGLSGIGMSTTGDLRTMKSDLLIATTPIWRWNEAESMMIDFAEVVVESRVPEIERQAIASAIDSLKITIAKASDTITNHVTKQTSPLWSVI
jgi:hypothetical protein